MSARRLGTGLPASPEWVGDCDVANPIAPASIASPTSSRMRSISASVALRSVASSPSTYSRNAVCPIIAATLSRLSMRSSVSRYSGKVSNDQSIPASSASTDIPSTFSSVRAITPRCSGRVGAIVKPQLPITTDVTPCQHDGVRSPCQVTCAS